jgi:2-dehydro-3-deoxygalactonokinase
VILIGSDTLTRRYSLALQHLGIACQSRGAEATWAGLYALAANLKNPS